MKFSEAMLLGLPEIRFNNNYFLHPTELNTDKECSGCLIGAALYAVGERDSRILNNIMRLVAKHWPWAWDKEFAFDCPHCKNPHLVSFDVADIATHLADHYEKKEMTAEQVAEYFRTIEPEEKEQEHGTEKHTVQRSHAARVAGD